jgi:hypothetical protein
MKQSEEAQMDQNNPLSLAKEFLHRMGSGAEPGPGYRGQHAAIFELFDKKTKLRFWSTRTPCSALP